VKLTDRRQAGTVTTGTNFSLPFAVHFLSSTVSAGETLRADLGSVSFVFWPRVATTLPAYRCKLCTCSWDNGSV
jgi:hypothetical protein